jgi:N-acetylated-alpha-linked acidic dipeptidase
MGIDVKGKIVNAKYGRSWRGIKPKVAQENGAIGCIIYSDPAEDGYAQGDVYPTGAFKNEYGVQRGSVMDMPVYPGDPLTPGYGHSQDAKTLEQKDATNLLKIPVLPISYHDAEPLLKSLSGPVAPAGWRGALPITYHIGPGKSTVHLKLLFNWEIKPLYNVVAKLKGTEFPDEWVIRGNHHDAWVNGANDPISGMAALMEEARAISELVKQGWKPKRTLVYCGWDGEEPGLLGSTEWVEFNAKELQQKAVVYINSDDNGRGFFGAAGSHALENFMSDVARDVTDPQTQISILERSQGKSINHSDHYCFQKSIARKEYPYTWAHWVQAPIILLFFSISVSLPLILDLAEKMREESIIRSMIHTIITSDSRIRNLNMVLHLPKQQDEAACAWPMQKYCLLISVLYKKL